MTCLLSLVNFIARALASAVLLPVAVIWWCFGGRRQEWRLSIAPNDLDFPQGADSEAGGREVSDGR